MQEAMNTFADASETGERLRTAEPSFRGLVGGELLKIKNQKTTWIMAALVLLLVLLPYIITYATLDPALFLQQRVFDYFVSQVAGLTRAGTGFFLLILTARVIGLEYQLGTVRVLLARGVGRLQLLLAKLATIGLVALLLLLGCLLLNAVMLGGVLAWHGSLNLLSAIGSHIALYTLTILVSAVVSVLLATAVTVLGRSLSFGLSAAIAFFPLDNFGGLLLPLGTKLTHAVFWQQITAYLLGPNLNQMTASLTKQPGLGFGFGPAVNVDGTHTLLVTLVYALAFATIAVVLTIKKDVQE
jgi:ABC-2 type transport system permease protein